MNPKPIIKVKNLAVTYFKGKPNETHSLKNINLEIFPGEFVIFFGPSGCGKSTLLYSISGLETNIDGEIFIDDKNISKLGTKELEHFHQQKIGMIFQAYYLIGSLSVLKNVILPQIASSGISNKERKRKALALLQKFGLHQEVHRFPSELSGGQQQRVAISRALINNPDVLLADEPTGNLDSKSSEDVLNLFSELNEQENKTIILVTHNPSNLDIAHRIFFMKDGEIVSVKRNRELNQNFSKKKEIPASQAGVPAHLRDLAVLQKAYAELSANESSEELTNFKARELLLEVLAGLTSDELSTIEKHVKKLLISGVDTKGEIFHYLDQNIKLGGLGFDRRTAHNISEKIKAIVKKIRFLEKKNKNQDTSWFNNTALQLRLYLEKEFKVKLKNEVARRFFHEKIIDRLHDKISSQDLQLLINTPVSKGGAGIHIRKAKKISNRLELLLLGKYNNKF